VSSPRGEKNAEFIYREAGKPDWLVMFCCDGCEEDFMKEPAKYLAKLAVAAKNRLRQERRRGQRA
jgi:hypothetical protein